MVYICCQCLENLENDGFDVLWQTHHYLFESNQILQRTISICGWYLIFFSLWCFALCFYVKFRKRLNHQFFSSTGERPALVVVLFNMLFICSLMFIHFILCLFTFLSDLKKKNLFNTVQTFPLPVILRWQDLPTIQINLELCL